MKIFIASNIFLNEKSDEKDLFFHEILKKIIAEQVADEFLFISSDNHTEEYKETANVRRIFTSAGLKNSILRKYWSSIKLPTLIKKNKIDLFLSLNGSWPSSISIPQLILVKEIALSDKISKQVAKNNSVIIVLSKLIEDKILQLYPFMRGRTKLIPVFYPGEKIAVDIYDKELIKQEYTSGKNYFLFNGNTADKKNLIFLLKAFSIFKKRQKSDWKFVFIGKFNNRDDRFLHELANYRYREDVIIIEKSENIKQHLLVAGSYAWINPIKEEEFGIAVLEPLTYEVPIIIANETAFGELAKDAALYFNDGDQQDLSNQLMFLYKDEEQRGLLIEKGKDRIKGLNVDKAADELWEVIRDIFSGR